MTGGINFPHMAMGPAVIRYDVGDTIARRNGTPMAPTACGEQIVSTLVTRHVDKINCAACNRALDQLLVKETIKALLRWVYDTVQPDGLVEQHHGAGHRVGDYFYRIIPGRDYCIVVMDVAGGAHQFDNRDNLLNPLSQHDVDQLKALLVDLGREPVDSWNGAGVDTVSIQIKGGAHPTLLAGIDQYHVGCPTHGSVFCDDNYGCTWYRDGNSKMVRPVWPTRDSLVVANA